jgi:enhancer of polycomb-like protein
MTIFIFFLVQHEAQLVDDGTAFSGFQQTSSRFGSSDDDYADSDDTTTEQTYVRSAVLHRYSDNKQYVPPLRIKRELKRRPQQNGWVFKRVNFLSISPSLTNLGLTITCYLHGI